MDSTLQVSVIFGLQSCVKLNSQASIFNSLCYAHGCLFVLVLIIMMKSVSLKILEMETLGECIQDTSCCPCLTPLLSCSFSPPTNNLQNIMNWRGVPCFFVFLYPWGVQTSRNIQPVSRRHLHLSGLTDPAWPSLTGPKTCVKSFTPSWEANCDDDPMCSHILGSLHSVLESQQNQHHK